MRLSISVTFEVGLTSVVERYDENGDHPIRLNPNHNPMDVKAAECKILLTMSCFESSVQHFVSCGYEKWLPGMACWSQSAVAWWVRRRQKRSVAMIRLESHGFQGGHNNVAAVESR